MNSKSGYMPQLDALRAISVIAVVQQHYGSVAINQALHPGIFGVRLFFVISGFLITGILLKSREAVKRAHSTPSKALRTFYVRRVLRIFPAYYALLFLVALADLPTVRETFWWHATYLSNPYYAGLGEWRGPVSHFWSLAVEEQFYLIWPFLVLFTPRRFLIAVLGLTVFLGPLTRFWLITVTENVVTTSATLPSCVDSLGCGAILAWLWQADRTKRPWITEIPKLTFRIGVGVALVLLCFKALDVGWRLRIALTDTAAAFIFVGVVNRVAMGYRGAVGRLLENPAIVYVGTISYGIYLYHNVIRDLLSSTGHGGVGFGLPPGNGGFQFLSALSVTLVLATVSWFALEKPMNSLKHRFPVAPQPAE